MFARFSSAFLVLAFLNGTSTLAATPAAAIHSPANAQPTASTAPEEVARATKAVNDACPAMPRRLVELFGVMAEGAGVGLIALYESPFALLDYLVSDMKVTADTRHPYFPSTEEHANDVRLRYRSLLEGVESPACLQAVCGLERAKSRDGHAVSPACQSEAR